MNPVPPSLGAWSLSHWATREVPSSICFSSYREFRPGQDFLPVLCPPAMCCFQNFPHVSFADRIWHFFPLLLLSTAAFSLSVFVYSGLMLRFPFPEPTHPLCGKCFLCFSPSTSFCLEKLSLGACVRQVCFRGELNRWSGWCDSFFSSYTTCSETAMATHSSTLAWKIPWTEEPGGLQSMGSLRVGHD